MKVLVIKSGEELKVREIDGSLESLQNIVGGFIECVALSKEFSERKIILICNEEGIVYNLPVSLTLTNNKEFSRAILGDCLFVKCVDDDFVSLDEEQIAFIESKYGFGMFELKLEEDKHLQVANIELC